jgi:ribonuclease HII
MVMAMPREAARTAPDFRRERRLIAERTAPVAGIDEAGRGPWAGPVVAAAVILNPGRIPAGLDDSKALDPAARERLFEIISITGLIGIGVADVSRIDRDNILQATHWAMQQAVASLPMRPAIALVDGNSAPELDIAVETIIAGDTKVASIAAASIVAKVTRDRLMDDLARSFPAYGFERHRGYGTPEHREAIRRHGLSPEHRRSFAPIREVLDRASALPAGDHPRDTYAKPVVYEGTSPLRREA